MELYVCAERFYPEIGSKIPIAFNSDEVFDNLPGLDDRLKIVLLKKGTAILDIDGKTLPVIAPAVFCINESETVQLLEHSGWQAVSVYFHPGYINNQLSFDKIRRVEEETLITNRQDISLFQPFVTRNESYIGQLNLDPSTFVSITSLMNSAKDEIEAQAHCFWSCRARSYILELLFSLTALYQSPDSATGGLIRNTSPFVNQIILYLNSNYGTRITISDLCILFGTNKTTLQEQFQQVTGQSIMAYLIALRVKIAAFMLKDTGLSVSEISDRLGFSDNAHFNKMFRKTTGYSPSQYRKQFSWMKRT
jgi:AraC family L-rhamnose operon regulatory protein RhaS